MSPVQATASASTEYKLQHAAAAMLWFEGRNHGRSNDLSIRAAKVGVIPGTQ